MCSNFLGCLIWIYFHQLLDWRTLGVQHVRVMLSKHTKSKLIMNESIPIGVFNSSHQSLDQS